MSTTPIFPRLTHMAEGLAQPAPVALTAADLAVLHRAAQSGQLSPEDQTLIARALFLQQYRQPIAPAPQPAMTRQEPTTLTRKAVAPSTKPLSLEARYRQAMATAQRAISGAEALNQQMQRRSA